MAAWPTRPLLIELGTEELPVKALAELAAGILRGICDGLAKRGIGAGPRSGASRCIAAPPRRAAFRAWRPRSPSRRSNGAARH